VSVSDIMSVHHLCFRCRKLAGRWRTSSGSATGARGRARCYTEWISDVRWRQWHIRTAAAATARDATNGPGTAFPRWTRAAHDAPLQRHDATSICEYLSSPVYSYDFQWVGWKIDVWQLYTKYDSIEKL